MRNIRSHRHQKKPNQDHPLNVENKEGDKDLKAGNHLEIATAVVEEAEDAFEAAEERWRKMEKRQA